MDLWFAYFAAFCGAGLDYRGNKCTAVVPHGTGTTAGTYRGTVLKKVPVTLPKARKLANRYRYLDIQSGSLVYGIGGYCYCLDEFNQIVIIFLNVFLITYLIKWK